MLLLHNYPCYPYLQWSSFFAIHDVFTFVGSVVAVFAVVVVDVVTYNLNVGKCRKSVGKMSENRSQRCCNRDNNQQSLGLGKVHRHNYPEHNFIMTTVMSIAAHRQWVHSGLNTLCIPTDQFPHTEYETSVLTEVVFPTLASFRQSVLPSVYHSTIPSLQYSALFSQFYRHFLYSQIKLLALTFRPLFYSWILNNRIISNHRLDH